MESKILKSLNFRAFLFPFLMVLFFVTLGFLAWLLFDKFEEEDSKPTENLIVSATPEKPTSTPTQTKMLPLKTSIHDGLRGSDLPPGLPDDTILVSSSERTDVVFFLSPPKRIVKEWYVPVVAMGVGIDSISKANLLKILGGSVTNWEDVGGLSGSIRVITGPFAELGPFEDLFDLSLVEQFESYEKLFKVMTFQSGTIAFVPIDQIVPSV
ncbi:uncharacterized protein METZ01_LOCUS427323, partial [marine metagenome]